MQLAGGTDGTLVKLMTIGKFGKTTDEAVEPGGTFEAEMPEMLMPKEFQMIPGEG